MKNLTIGLLLILITINCYSQSLSKGFKYLDKNNIIEAKTEFEGVLKESPKSSPVLYGLAECYFQGNDVFKAYLFNRDANTNFSLLDEKTLKKTSDFFSKKLIDEQFVKIDKVLFQYIINNYGTEIIEKYLYQCPESKYTKNIIAYRDSMEFTSTKKINTVISYNAYIKNYPNSQYILSAKNNRDSIAYIQCVNANTLAICQSYLDSYPVSKYRDKVIALRNSLAFGIADKIFSIEAYNDFINKYPDADEISKAKENIAFLNADKRNSVSAYKNFIQEYPNSKLVISANELIDGLILDSIFAINTVAAYKAFIKNYPNSKQYDRAIRLLDKAAFEIAKINNTSSSLKKYLFEYPNSDYKDIAISMLDSIYSDSIFKIKKNSLAKFFIDNTCNLTIDEIFENFTLFYDNTKVTQFGDYEDYCRYVDKRTLYDLTCPFAKLVAALNLDVITYYKLADKYNSELKKKVFFESDEYKSYLTDLTKIKNDYLSKNYYFIGLNGAHYEFYGLNAMGGDASNKYDIKKGGFVLNTELEEVKNMTLNLIYNFSFKQVPFYPDTKTSLQNDIFIKVDTKTGLEIEEDMKNVSTLWCYKISDKVVTYSKYGSDHYTVPVSVARLIVYNRISHKIYYDKIYK